MVLFKETTKRRYYVTEDGRIFSESKKTLKMKRKVAEQGAYLRVNIDYETLYVHRIVAEAFLGADDWYNEVNHKDGNKHNNHASNLEWCNRQQNQEHALSKEWKVINPKGDVLTFSNLNKFCREEGLTPAVMYELFRENSRYAHHKGYKAFKNQSEV